jgi:hypothetical protein
MHDGTTIIIIIIIPPAIILFDSRIFNLPSTKYVGTDEHRLVGENRIPMHASMDM